MRTESRRPQAVQSGRARWVVAGWLVAAASIPMWAHDQVPAPAPSAPVLLAGGDLHTVGQGVLAATDLLFTDGRIVAIGKNLEAPAGATVVDVRGKRVYPGLIAANTVLGLREIDAVRASLDDTEVGSVRPEVAAHTAWNPDTRILPTLRPHGITTVQVAPRGGLVAGRSMVVRLDGWNKEDAALALVDGMWVVWPEAFVPRPRENERRAAERREAASTARAELRSTFADARAWHAAQAAGRRPRADQRWEAFGPVLAREQPLYVVANGVVEIREALAFAREQEVSLVLVGAREADVVAAEIAAARVPVILDDTWSLPFRDDDAYDQAYARPAVVAAALAPQGVPLCLAVDGSWQVRNLAFQAGHAVGFGLSGEAALRAITLGCAEILGIADRQGSLAVGKEATLFVSRGDILDTLGHQVEAMWIAGRPVDLDDDQQELARKYRQKP
jgi:imidazolonepropionase-like amidohydrolase